MDPLSGIADDVDPRRVRALLVNRNPALLDPANPDHDLFAETVAGVATEVVPLVGADPADFKIPPLQEYVGDDATKAAAVLELEQARGKDARATLVKHLEAIITPPAS